jgi:hypothetical protein
MVVIAPFVIHVLFGFSMNHPALGDHDYGNKHVYEIYIEHKLDGLIQNL